MLDGSKTADQPAVGYMVRLYWMVFGNIALFFVGLKIASSAHLGLLDAVYGALTLTLLSARWVDITKLNGMTIHALRATRAQLRNYAFALTGVALLGWAVARWASTLG